MRSLVATLLMTVGSLSTLFSSSPIFILSESEDVALARTNSIWAIDENIGLTRDELFCACQFIEKIQHTDECRKKVFLQRVTKVPCVIERLSSPKGFLIRDLPTGRSRIGRGVHKVVHKAILYGKHPKIVAHCVSDQSGAHEIAILKRLHRCPGIVPYLGSVARPEHKYSIFLEYFLEGSLGRKIKSGYRFSIRQMVKIAKDCAEGLRGMHKLHLIHRDLHAGNILLRKASNGLFDAVLIDFGKTISLDHVKETDVPQAAKNHNPPEVLRLPFSKIQRYLADIYALGCDYYSMMWNQSVPWAESYDVYKMQTYGPLFRERLYKEVESKYSRDRKKKIGKVMKKKRKGIALSPCEHFQRLIFQMIDCEPTHRPSVSTLVQQLEEIARGQEQTLCPTLAFQN